MHPDALVRLPIELAHAVFRLLEFRDRIAVSHVSRGWCATALADPFLWNVADFSVDPNRKWNPLVCYPPPGQPNWKPPPRPPPPRKADILRALLARSDPAPFTLLWENQEPAQLPDEMAELVLQNMHRMEELTADLSPHAFARLFAHPAPARCSPRWRWRSYAYPRRCNPSPQSKSCSATSLLHIESVTPEVVCRLGIPPTTLEELVLRTESESAIEYTPLLAACRACKLDLLRLAAVRELAPVLDLFTGLVEGTWALKADRDGCYVQLQGDTEDVDFAVHLVQPLSFAPIIMTHLARLSSLSVDASLFASMGAWTGILPSSPRKPITAPLLEDVAIILSRPQGAALWVADEFPALLRARFAYDRPLLASITIEADSDVAQEISEVRLARLKAVAECVRIEVPGRTRE